jgi:hypothetical protein
MTTDFHGGSAKIYQFPARARLPLGGHREDVERSENRPAPNLASPRVARAAFGSAWYHDEAIQEAERTGEI